MTDDVSIRMKYRKAIIEQIKKEINPSDNDLELMRDRLNKASSDELERTYEAFERFGVQVILDTVIKWRFHYMKRRKYEKKNRRIFLRR